MHQRCSWAKEYLKGCKSGILAVSSWSGQRCSISRALVDIDQGCDDQSGQVAFNFCIIQYKVRKAFVVFSEIAFRLAVSFSCAK